MVEPRWRDGDKIVFLYRSRAEYFKSILFRVYNVLRAIEWKTDNLVVGR